MREIKFRAWSKLLKCFVTDFVIDRVGNEYQYDHCEFYGDDRDVVIMQYTGLKDKNDKEIYEGDIVAGYKGDFVHNVIGVVKYCGLSFVFEGTTEENRYDISGGKGDNYWRYTVTNPSVKELPEIEVIGNIHEHPELLKRHC